jgi:hypothetical protein
MKYIIFILLLSSCSNVEIHQIIDSKDVKNNFGVYEMKLEMGNNIEENFFVIYTTYNGVVIQGYNKSGTAMDQFYKSDDLEKVILRLFQP